MLARISFESMAELGCVVGTTLKTKIAFFKD
jgi:hypothetical protein